MFKFAGGVKRIGVDNDAAGSDGTNHGDWKLQNVWQHDGDSCAGLEPKCLQVIRKAARLHVELGEGQRLAHIQVRVAVGKALKRIFK